MELTNIEKQWIDDNYVLLRKLYPKVPKDKIKEKLLKILKKNIQATPITMTDTYRNKVYKSDTVQLTEFCNKVKPLTAGNGVLFDRDANNPSIKMLNKIGDRRNSIKKDMYNYDPDSYEFSSRNLKQKNEKVKVNAW